ncbi:hypothetical protein [Reyranella sp.]|uniref:hypothetical protein n=1 Tax=Reyranella sp. TaxID=1929291 RepID=UPI0037841C8E
MRCVSPIVPPSILALLCSLAMSALAQSDLAQQCAAFGQGQYRQLDPSVDRVTAMDFPPPALERFNGQAGSQPVAAALTLRGRLTYRNRSPLETQFVCLLDRSERPLFFYALPALVTRAAPTPPVGRGAPVPQLQHPTTQQPSQLTMALTPQATPRADAPARPANATRLRGLVRDVGGRLLFTPCDGAPLALEDRTQGQELLKSLRELTAAQEGRPMFVEIYGVRETGTNAGIGVVDLRRAAVETAGCRERFDQREWIATGNEPSWRLEVTSRDMVMSVLGGLSTQRVPHGGPQKSGNGLEYASSDGTDLLVTIDERRCIDNQSGSLFAYVVEVRSEGRTYPGCAAHNPAMPAP